MPALSVASVFHGSMVLSVERRPGAAVSIVRHELEYVFDEGPLSRVQPSVGMDLVPAMFRMGPSRGLVRARLRRPGLVALS